MAVMLVFDGPEMTKAQYDALRPEVQWESNPPEGLLLHSCAFDDNGGLHVVDLWESPVHAQSFFESRLKPGFEKLGINSPPPAFYEVHNINAFSGLHAASRA